MVVFKQRGRVKVLKRFTLCRGSGGIQTKRACQGIETFHPMSGKWWVFKQRGRVKVLKRFTLCRGSGGYSNKEGVSRY